MKYVEIDNHKMHIFAAGDEIKQQKILLKRNAMNPCYENEAEAISENAEIVNKGGRIECPILMFISDGCKDCISELRTLRPSWRPIRAKKKSD